MYLYIFYLIITIFNGYCNIHSCLLSTWYILLDHILFQNDNGSSNNCNLRPENHNNLGINIYDGHHKKEIFHMIIPHN